MGISKGYVFESLGNSLSLMDFIDQGQHTGRSGWSGPLGGLRFTEDRVGRHEQHPLELDYARWDVPMDEPRALYSGGFRSQRRLPDETVGLLCARNGDIRSSERESAIYPESWVRYHRGDY